MKLLTVIITLSFLTSAFAIEPAHFPLLAQIELQKPVSMQTAKPRMMTLYEQGWQEGVKTGGARAGKVGWFFAGFGNLPLLWLPWVVEPSHPAKPNIEAEVEFNNGFKQGYRAGWKNTHKAYYIAGAIVETVAAGAIIAASK